jgi:hypothetical protein
MMWGGCVLELELVTNPLDAIIAFTGDGGAATSSTSWTITDIKVVADIIRPRFSPTEQLRTTCIRRESSAC